MRVGSKGSLTRQPHRRHFHKSDWTLGVYVIRSRSLVLVLACALAGISLAPSGFAASEPSEIERLLSPEQTHLDGHLIATKPLRTFYAPRNYQPLWTGDQAQSMAAALKQVATDHGLPPAAYAVGADLTDANLDVALSASALRLGRDLATGRIPPYRLVGGIGESTRPHFDSATFLKTLAHGTDGAEALNRLAPQSHEYQSLMTGLKSLRALAAAGGWPPVADGPSIKPGETDDRIPSLRRRLIASGDLVNADEAEGNVLDEVVSAALKLFQIRHGLETDGALGKRTLQALNVPVNVRIHQIELAMERLRQLPRQREANRIDVNIAAQSLILYENKMPALEMRVITGDVKHQTPTMTTRDAAITLNPTWTVPPSIARKEILPKLKRDPNYLAHNNIHIVDNNPAAPPEPEQTPIDWSKLGNSFPFVLRQVPGPDNALGQIKFNLQNQDSIYMHDTNQKTLFKRSYRLLSHGCIRLEHPMDLAEALLGSEWHDKLPPLIADGKTRTLILKHALPVYLMYQTAWAGADGILFFRDDAYGNDQRLDQALAQSALFATRDSSGDNL